MKGEPTVKAESVADVGQMVKGEPRVKVKLKDEEGKDRGGLVGRESPHNYTPLQLIRSR